MSQEIWKPILGYEDRYEVSSCGSVRSLNRISEIYNGGTFKRQGRLLKQSLNKGYFVVGLFKDGNTKRHLVHRLVCLSFAVIGPNDWVNHKNGVKTDNRLSNLEKSNPQHNIAHARSTGLLKNIGERNGKSKLTVDDVIEIRRLASVGVSDSEIERLMDLGKGQAYNVRLRTWKHVNV